MSRSHPSITFTATDLTQQPSSLHQPLPLTMGKVKIHRHKPLGVVQCDRSTLFPLSKSFEAFTITFIILVNWLWEWISIVSSIRLNRKGRIPFVLMVGMDHEPSEGKI
ncbi:hypothetical protein RYX36_010099 [Vicia faba]